MKISIGGNLVVALLLFTIVGCIVVFNGSPDLHDVLLNRLSDGKVPLPTVSTNRTWE